VGARSPAGWLVLPAAIGLIAIVALASRSGLAVPAVDLPVAWSPLTLVEIVAYVAMGVGLFVVPVALLMYRRSWRTRPAQRREHALPSLPWGVRLLGVALVVALVAAQIFIAFALFDEVQRGRGEGFEPGGPGAGPTDPVVPGVAAPDPTALMVAAVVLAVLAVVALAVVVRWRVLDRPSDVAATERSLATQAALDVSLDALRREPDPRRAVIVAYGAMESCLAKAGFGRHRSEAPLEYLRRVLHVSRLADDHLRTITALFQHARFSNHPVLESMRTEAIDALGGVRAAIGERA
jgi:hypothetical protein